ncbi:hypothetical protein ABQF26_03705 [Mycolicibacterium elephantis]
MTWNRREGAPYRLRAALKQFAEHDVALPKAVDQAVALLDRIEATPPADPDPRALHDAIIDGASPDQLDQIALRQLAHGRVRDAWAQARLTAAADALDAILNHRNDIHEQLAEVADDCISKLERIAALGDARLDELIRTGRTDDARALADKAVVATTLDALYQLRDTVLVQPGLDPRPGGVDCTRWRNPGKARNLHGDLADRYLAGITRGAGLHYPTPEQAAELAAPIAAELAEAAERRRQAQHGVGAIPV